MKIYLSGPMKGYPNLNYAAFHRAAKMLRTLGYTVYNPAEWEGINNDGIFNHILAFDDYCRFIVREADCVVVLPGWEDSEGATAETAVGFAVKKPCYPIELFEEEAKRQIAALAESLGHHITHLGILVP